VGKDKHNRQSLSVYEEFRKKEKRKRLSHLVLITREAEEKVLCREAGGVTRLGLKESHSNWFKGGRRVKANLAKTLSKTMGGMRRDSAVRRFG